MGDNNIDKDIEDKIQIAAVTVYKWDKNGDLVVRNINLTDLKVTGTTTLENLKVNENLNLTDGNITNVNEINASIGKFGNITATLVNEVDFTNITVSGTEIIWEIII